jgi:hypothetical protein
MVKLTTKNDRGTVKALDLTGGVRSARQWLQAQLSTGGIAQQLATPCFGLSTNTRSRYSRTGICGLFSLPPCTLFGHQSIIQTTARLA